MTRSSISTGGWRGLSNQVRFKPFATSCVIGSGGQAGLETVLIKGDEARLTFRRDAAPRLAGLQVALEAVQFEADVRRAVPLSLRLRRLGGESIGPGLVRALTAVLRDHHR